MKYLVFTLALAVALCASRADSQTFKTLLTFTGTGGAASGKYPDGNLTLVGTALYGMTSKGGTKGFGNIFSVGLGGTNYQNLVSFTGTAGTATGAYPNGSLTLAGTTFYGMTQAGGANASGNVFSIGIGGLNYQDLLSFTAGAGTVDALLPGGSLTLVGTTLFGMTEEGGANGYGNIISVGTNGANYRSLLSFTGTGGLASGGYPVGSLTLVGTTFYGMTSGQLAGGYGNVFSVGTNGANYQNLLSFTGTGGSAIGSYPFGDLTLEGTTLYGMTQGNGVGGWWGNIFSVGMDGTNYKNLVSFTGTGGSATGSGAVGSLILSGTTLYGFTPNGGASGNGNIFNVGIDGSDFQDLYSFSGGTDGAYPGEGELLLSGGTLFGFAQGGGSAPGFGGNGTVFALVLPEPGTLALAGAATVALFSYRWRRRRSQWENPP